MNRIEVFLVEDHALVRAGLKALINQFDGFVVTGEAANVTDAMALIEACRPQIVLTDISLGGENGLDLLRILRARWREPSVVIVSMHGEEALVSEALRLGAAGYLLKDAAPGELEIALGAVCRHQTYVSPLLSRKLVERHLQRLPAEQRPLDMLTPRQIQILTMIASRKGTKEIAYDLGLSAKTVAAHRAQIMQRIGVRDLVGLVLFALKNGLISVESQ